MSSCCDDFHAVLHSKFRPGHDAGFMEFGVAATSNPVLIGSAVQYVQYASVTLAIQLKRITKNPEISG
ncbi:hypothetical protein GX50_01050 [[Emmonsia] crescens]|uniref:Uncharacterized protein n=1 Tax=[Emmonsia] crescens TaxID=73230 RepID=A0A2B7ZS67_9EURO|nr:hypothetical protein GX50_01050 [Emmonsia crescens]